jgi:hypothetical protein
MVTFLISVNKQDKGTEAGWEEGKLFRTPDSRPFACFFRESSAKGWKAEFSWCERKKKPGG